MGSIEPAGCKPLGACPHGMVIDGVQSLGASTPCAAEKCPDPNIGAAMAAATMEVRMACRIRVLCFELPLVLPLI
jgi:hypothetical protein